MDITEENTPGLDHSTAEEWIYPTNYSVREYQKNIVSKALFQNTLVSLPTGLGKTFIAAVVMYNFNRWYPNNKIIFMAHSKPLVAQQIDACCHIMGISKSVTAELNGNIPCSTRKLHWDSKQIFFLTPQVFNNDLTRGLVPAESIRCVVIDEAHKALGNQAFCQSIRALQPFNKHFRVLALSATPGDDIQMVKNVIENLLISHLELRTEEDSDIKKYLHEKKVEAVVVTLDSKIIEFKNLLLKAAEKYLQQLVNMKAINNSFGSLSSFSLVLKQKQFIGNPSVGTEQRGLVLSNFSIVISIYKALEELVVHGLRSFHNKLLTMKTGEGSNNTMHHRLGKDLDFLSLIDMVDKYIGQDKDIAFDPNVSMARLQDELDAQVEGQTQPIVYSHPKFVLLEQIIVDHFEEWKKKDESTRVIVFCKSRPCTGEICNFLNRFRPLIKPMVLIGQSQASGGSTSRGLKQSAQLEVMRKFRGGTYNTLVATCVGEEGLDVGEVDLIINFDATRNSNTQVQRSGRTGRKRDGRVVNLLTEGKEYQDYNIAVAKSKNITKKLSTGIKNLPLYPNSPRLLPGRFHPVCQEMFLKPIAEVEKKQKTDVTSNKPKKKKVTNKKLKKSEVPSSQAINAKYDIRYAMSKAGGKLKSQSTLDDTSDSLFESVGAVEIFKHNKKGLMHKQGSFSSPQREVEVICLEDSNDNFDIKNIDENILSNNTAKSNNMSIPDFSMDSFNLEMCDKLDNLNLSDLVMFVSKNKDNIKMPKKYANHQTSSLLINENEETEYNFNYVEISLNDELNNALPNSLTEWSSSPFLEEVNNENRKSPLKLNVDEIPTKNNCFSNNPACFTSAATPIANVSMVTVTQAISMIASIQKQSTIVGETTNDISQVAPNGDNGESASKMVNHASNAFKQLSPVLNLSREYYNNLLESSQIYQNKDKTHITIYPEILDGKKSQQNPLSVKATYDNEGSPSLVSFCTYNNHGTSKVKKSLNFGNEDQQLNIVTSQSSLGFLNIDSDDDIFAEDEKEREVILSQRNSIPHSQLNSAKDLIAKPEWPPPTHKYTTPQTAIVRPMGFEDRNPSSLNDSGWLSTIKRPKEPTLVSLTKKKFKYKHLDKSQKSLDSFVVCHSVKTPDRVPPFENSHDNLNRYPHNLSLSTFDCIPEDLANFFDDTSFQINPQTSTPRPISFANSKKPNSITKSVANNFKTTSTLDISRNSPKNQVLVVSDDDFSDGALEALKAVDEFEKKCKVSETSINRSTESEPAVFNLWSSDNSDDLFEISNSKSKNSTKRTAPLKNNPKKKSRKNCIGRKKRNPFVEDEADISDRGSCVSSDDENTSGLDDLDSSFLDERIAPTQAPDVDMTARYLATVRSPRVVPGGFKIPNPVKYNADVFSQVVNNDEDYVHDSFCVGEDVELVEDELSDLELAELALERKKKRRKRKSPEYISLNQKKKKRRRIITAESSSEEEKETKAKSPINSHHNKSNNKYSTVEASTVIINKSSVSLSNKSSTYNNIQKLVFIGSRQIASAPEITISLRSKFNFKVEVRSCPGADFIVGWRLGINRVTLSDFCNGSPTTKVSFRESIIKLTELFIKPFLIVEDDKNKGLSRTVGCHKDMWMKHSAKKLTKLCRSGVTTLFSRNKDETAKIIGNLTEYECKKGHGVVTDWPEITPQLEAMLKFYTCLPGINIAMALRICRKFSTLSCFLSSCDSVDILIRELSVSKSTAINIYHALHLPSNSL